MKHQIYRVHRYLNQINKKRQERSGLREGTLLCILCIGACASCTVSAPMSEMDRVEALAPESWAQSKVAQKGVDYKWIKRFKSRVLVSLVEEAVAQQPDLKVVAEKVRQAELAAQIAGAAAKPQLTGGLTGARQKQSFLGFPGGGSNRYSSYGVSLDGSWEVDLWGRIRSGQSAAIGEWQATSYEAQAAKMSLVAQVSKAWFTLAEANEQVRLAQEHVQWREHAVSLIRNRLNHSSLSDQTRLVHFNNASAELKTARSRLVQEQGDVQIAANQLELLLGRYPASRLKQAKFASEGLEAVPVGVPSELLMRRPDVLAAERRLAASVTRVKEAYRAVFPQIVLTGQAGSVTSQFQSLLSSGIGTWSLGANVVQPILRGGQIKAQIEQRKSLQRERVASLQKTVLQAFGEVEQALILEQSIRNQRGLIQQAIQHARSGVENAEADFQEGMGDSLTMIEAHTQLLNLLTQEITLQGLFYRNRVNLHVALGGDFRSHKP